MQVLALKKLTEENHPLLVKLTAEIDARLGTESRVSIKTEKSLLNKAKVGIFGRFFFFLWSDMVFSVLRFWQRILGFEWNTFEIHFVS